MIKITTYHDNDDVVRNWLNVTFGPEVPRGSDNKKKRRQWRYVGYNVFVREPQMAVMVSLKWK